MKRIWMRIPKWLAYLLQPMLNAVGAYAITTPPSGEFVVAPGMVNTYADQANGNGATITLLNPAKWFMVRIWQKTFTAGTGTQPVAYELQSADDSGFTVNVRRGMIGQVSRNANGTVYGMVNIPDTAQKFIRVIATPNGTDTCTYDAEIAAAT